MPPRSGATARPEMTPSLRTARGELMPGKRRAIAAVTIIAALAAVAVTATTAAGRSHDNVTLTVDVFGDFGYKDLYKQYEAAHPGITIKEDSEDYAPHHTALAQHLA